MKGYDLLLWMNFGKIVMISRGDTMFEKCLELLLARGVKIEDIVDCVIHLQKDYVKNINKAEVEEYVLSVIGKREVQHAIMTGIELDMLAEAKMLKNKDLEAIIQTDQSLYGVDEVLAYGICNLYGSIALTNYGYIDRVKPGIIGRLNSHDSKHCHTFLDDIVGAIAASAASRAAHNGKDKE